MDGALCGCVFLSNPSTFIPCAICKAQTVDLLATCCDHLNVWLPEPVVVTWAAWTSILCHFVSFPLVCLGNRVPIHTLGFTPPLDAIDRTFDAPI